MKGIVLNVGKQKRSFHGGIYIRALFKDISENSKGEKYLFDCYLEHSRSARFLPCLKEQAIFDNLDVIDYKGKKVVSGNSNFQYLGQRH